MANQYTVTTVTTAESVGDSVAAGSIAPTAQLVITPNAGRSVQASDFSIGNSLPTEVTSVTFADTTTALDPTNQVIATVTLASWYTMPSGADTISVDIDGRTHGYEARLSWTSVTTAVSNVTQTYTASNNTASTTGDVTTNTSFLDIKSDQTPRAVFTMRFAAASNFHFTTTPSYRIISSDSSRWSVEVTNAASTRTHNNNNQLIDILYTFYYRIGEDDVTTLSGERVIFDAPVVAADKVSYTHINSIYYSGYKHQGILPAQDNNLILNVSGTEDATYKLKIEDSNGLSYDFSSNTFTRALTFSDVQTIYSPSVQRLRNREPRKNIHTISIPTKSRKTDFEESFVTTVIPTGTTKSSTDGTSTAEKTITLNQFGRCQYTFSTVAGTYGVNTSTTTIKSIFANSAFFTPQVFDPVYAKTRETANNGYFTFSENLSYTTTSTVDNGSGISASGNGGVTVRLDDKHADKKLRVGDTITGTNIAADTTLATLRGGGGTEDYEVITSKDIAGTVADATTLTFSRTVGISRQPAISDITSTLPVVSSATTEHLVYRVKQSTSNSIFVSLKDTEDDGFAGLVVGMLVEGQNIIGYPKIVSISAAGEISLTTSQTLTAGDAIRFSIAGSVIRITELNVTGAGTSDCKLNVSGYVLRLGNVDVTVGLNLANFITAYAVPSMDATTATCPLGGSVVIKPLSTVTSHTGTLTINATPSSGAGTTEIEDDGQSIRYTAPATDADLSDTITYTVNDGINTSSAQNIVITLTQ